MNGLKKMFDAKFSTQIKVFNAHIIIIHQYKISIQKYICHLRET